MNNSNNTNTNIVFYSQKCDTCRTLLTLLKNENLLGHFKLVSVDDKLDKLPQNMIVPTMIVINVNKPLIAQETFEWIKQMKFIRQQQVMDINKKIIQQNLINNNTKKGPAGFDSEIMAGISDKFAFTKADIPLPHAYFGVNEEDKNAIFTAPKDIKKLSKMDQNNLIKELESKRSQQDIDYNSFMKQQQLSAVVNAEHEKLNQSNQSNQSSVDNPQQLIQQQMMQQQMLQQQMMQQQMMQQQMLQQQMLQQNNRRHM